MKIYKGSRRRWGSSCMVENGKTSYWLHPLVSQKLRNHSPDGFEWGYGGSGPSQLALAILLDFTRNKKIALRFYQDFKWRFVAGFEEEWELTENQVGDWLASATTAA